VSQYGRAVGQLVLLRHSTHFLLDKSHAGRAGLVQFELARHCTHRPEVSQTGAWGLVQLAAVQGGTQTKLRGSHNELVPEQSAFDTHATQRFCSQYGVAPLQSVLPTHCTQRLLLHTGRAVGQLAPVVHSTHTPAALQMAAPVQSACERQLTQVFEAEQNGVWPLHVDALVHCTHRPEVVLHAGVAPEQLALLLHAAMHV
jgi:hypothetical protein